MADSFTKQDYWTTVFTLHLIDTDMFFWFNWGLEFYSESRFSKCINDRINETFSASSSFPSEGPLKEMTSLFGTRIF